MTQIQVRVDCNGCVQKIKKALDGINGIHDLRVDFHRQKVTVIGWADPERIVKAIKKTKKNAIICSNIELASPSRDSQPTETKGNASAPDATQPHQQQQPPPEATTSPKPSVNNANQRWQRTPRTNRVGEVHVIHHNLPNIPVFVQQTPQPVYVTHSYNTYMPSPYVTEYEYVRSPPSYKHYHNVEHYSGDYPNGNVSFTSMFSDDNPNACTIV
ncbi:hypothetical protein Lal_00006545 [Lupinus albus]|uniref:Putative heavy metal-associated domain, HMA n=1 Tax=Lupinus albus TaxID=3870 RepID=A0A6A5MMD0_LUPAL|nr:putative heavy metal-associated domain, HMA [Lupinus albus]KAF1875914.1 hypothetical protein Lal_00006545 [Lupinus albus]